MLNPVKPRFVSIVCSCHFVDEHSFVSKICSFIILTTIPLYRSRRQLWSWATRRMRLSVSRSASFVRSLWCAGLSSCWALLAVASLPSGRPSCGHSRTLGRRPSSSPSTPRSAVAAALARPEGTPRAAMHLIMITVDVDSICCANSTALAPASNVALCFRCIECLFKLGFISSASSKPTLTAPRLPSKSKLACISGSCTRT